LTKFFSVGQPSGIWICIDQSGKNYLSVFIPLSRFKFFWAQKESLLKMYAYIFVLGAYREHALYRLPIQKFGLFGFVVQDWRVFFAPIQKLGCSRSVVDWDPKARCDFQYKNNPKGPFWHFVWEIIFSTYWSHHFYWYYLKDHSTNLVLLLFFRSNLPFL
jgi:hypothetical protein